MIDIEKGLRQIEEIKSEIIKFSEIIEVIEANLIFSENMKINEVRDDLLKVPKNIRFRFYDIGMVLDIDDNRCLIWDKVQETWLISFSTESRIDQVYLKFIESHRDLENGDFFFMGGDLYNENEELSNYGLKISNSTYLAIENGLIWPMEFTDFDDDMYKIVTLD